MNAPAVQIPSARSQRVLRGSRGRRSSQFGPRRPPLDHEHSQHGQWSLDQREAYSYADRRRTPLPKSQERVRLADTTGSVRSDGLCVCLRRTCRPVPRTSLADSGSGVSSTSACDLEVSRYRVLVFAGVLAGGTFRNRADHLSSGQRSKPDWLPSGIHEPSRPQCSTARADSAPACRGHHSYDDDLISDRRSTETLVSAHRWQRDCDYSYLWSETWSRCPVWIPDPRASVLFQDTFG
jgi:hypothetical protein